MKFPCSVCKRQVENHFLKVNAKAQIVCVNCYFEGKFAPEKEEEKEDEKPTE